MHRLCGNTVMGHEGHVPFEVQPTKCQLRLVREPWANEAPASATLQLQTFPAEDPDLPCGMCPLLIPDQVPKQRLLFHTTDEEPCCLKGAAQAGRLTKARVQAVVHVWLGIRSIMYPSLPPASGSCHQAAVSTHLETSAHGLVQSSQTHHSSLPTRTTVPDPLLFPLPET